MTNKKTDVWTLIDTKNLITFEEFKEQLIHYKSSISWIDKYGTKHYMYGKDPILNDEGEVDFEMATKIWRENDRKCYDWIRENKLDLLIKKDNGCQVFSLISRLRLGETNLVIINYMSCLFPTYHNQNN